MWGLHYTLRDLASSLDRICGLQILVDFTLSFITLTYGIYFCMRCVTQLHIQIDVTESAGVTRIFSISVVWLSLVTIRLVGIAASCNTANTETNYTTHIRRGFSWNQSAIRKQWGRPNCFCRRWLNDLCTSPFVASSPLAILHWGQSCVQWLHICSSFYSFRKVKVELLNKELGGEKR